MKTSCALLTILTVATMGTPIAAQTTSESARVDQIAREAAQKFAEARAAGASEVGEQTRPTVPPPPPGVRTELTLDSAVERALDRNLDLAVERLTPQTYDFALAGLDATFHPNLISTFGTRNQTTFTRSQTAGGDILTTEHGLDDTKPRGALLISAAHPLADKWFTFIAMIGCLLIVPAALGAMSLVRVKAARLGLLGGVLMITGYICYFAMLFQGYATIALAQHGAANTDNIAVQNLIMNQGFFIVVALTFVAGNLIGTFLLGLALYRARVVPRWAAALVLLWPVAHILGGPWGEVLGAAAEAVGLAVVGLTVLRNGARLPVPPKRTDTEPSYLRDDLPSADRQGELR